MTMYRSRNIYFGGPIHLTTKNGYGQHNTFYIKSRVIIYTELKFKVTFIYLNN